MIDRNIMRNNRNQGTLSLVPPCLRTGTQIDYVISATAEGRWRELLREKLQYPDPLPLSTLQTGIASRSIGGAFHCGDRAACCLSSGRSRIYLLPCQIQGLLHCMADRYIMMLSLMAQSRVYCHKYVIVSSVPCGRGTTRTPWYLTLPW